MSDGGSDISASATALENCRLVSVSFSLCKLGRNGCTLRWPMRLSFIRSRATTGKCMVGVNLEAAIDPALLDTFPAGYQHMVDLIPGVMVTRDPGKTVYVLFPEP